MRTNVSKRLLSILLCVVMTVCILPAAAFAVQTGDDYITVNVSMSLADKLAVTKDGMPVASLSVNLPVNDTSVDRAIYEMHEQYYEGGAEAGYGTYESAFGLSMSMLWGVTEGVGSYYINDEVVYDSVDVAQLKDGDKLHVVTFGDDWDRCYTYFNKSYYSAGVKQELNFVLSYISFNANWEPVSNPLANAPIYVNGEPAGFSDDEGIVTLRFRNEGSYIVTAGSPENVKIIAASPLYIDVIQGLLQWHEVYGTYADNNSIVDVKTARSVSETVELWSTGISNGEIEASPAGLIIVDDFVYTAAANYLYKLDTITGEYDRVELYSTVGYGKSAPAYEQGYIYIGQNGGVIEAINIDTLETSLVYENPAAGSQALSAIVCDNGYLYTGFWSSETGDADFVCIDAGTGDEVWSYTHTGGFYWARAYVYGDYIVTASDNGTNSQEDNGQILVFNKMTGELVCGDNLKGDLRSDIVFDEDTGKLYTVSKSGWLYEFTINTADKSIASSGKDLGGEATGAPVIYNGYVYVAVSSATYGLSVVAVNSALEVADTVKIGGYAQAGLLASTAYVASENTLYLYAACNNATGAISVIPVGLSGDAPEFGEAEVLFTPAGQAQGYCVIRPVADADGTLYYANDSGYVFAVGRDVLAKFDDIDETAWYYNYVRYAVEQGLYNGVSDTQLDPNGTMTRAMFVTVLGRLYELGGTKAELPKDPKTAFSDVNDSGSWYYRYVYWAGANHITNGVSATEFGPGRNVTRQQMAAFLYNYAESMGYELGEGSDLSAFGDADSVASWAQDAMEWAVGIGLVNGINGSLEPNGDATRAQVAAIIQRFAEYYEL